MKEILNKLILLIALNKANNWNELKIESNISVNYYKGYPILEVQSTTFTIWFIPLEWKDKSSNILIFYKSNWSKNKKTILLSLTPVR